MQNSPARSSVDVGSVLGTYTIEALVGRGGMGAVFLASHNRLPGTKVAIKVLHAEMGGDEILARFKREADIASMLSQHPNIVRIDDYNVTEDGMPYLVLEYLRGESLGQRLRHGPMSVDQVFPVIRQVGSALAAAHAKGIVHRDLKPANIFLMPTEIDGRTMEIVKVLDFGISKMRDSQTVKTQDSALLGTPQYMAPEQALGQHDKVDERTDIFALGAIVYEMLCGQPAFAGQTIPEVVFKVVYEAPIPLATRVPNLPEQVTSAVQRALAKPADERFPSVTAFLEALTGAPVSIIRNSPVLPPPPAFDGTGPTSASGQTPHTGKDAFAQTMGSGDHGASPVTAPVARDAVTVSSQAGRVAAPNLGVANTVASSEQPRVAATAAPGGSNKTLLVISGVLVAAVAAAGIMYAVMRQPPKPPASAAVTPAIEQAPKPEVPQVEKDLLAANHTQDGGAAPDPIEPTGTKPDVEAKPDPTAKPDPNASKPNPNAKPDPKKAKPPVTTADSDAEPEDANDDSHAGKKLKQAFGAIANHRWKDAGEAATFVTTAEDARPKQLMQAQMILGIAACRTNDEEGGRRALRALGARYGMRAKVLAACHEEGYLLGAKK